MFMIWPKDYLNGSKKTDNKLFPRLKTEFLRETRFLET